MNEAGVRKGKRDRSILGFVPFGFGIQRGQQLFAKGFCVEVFGRCSYSGVGFYRGM
jgi:hypothetical protein